MSPDLRSKNMRQKMSSKSQVNVAFYLKIIAKETRLKKCYSSFSTNNLSLTILLKVSTFFLP